MEIKISGALRKRFGFTEDSYPDLAWPIRFLFGILRRNLSKIWHGYAIWSELFLEGLFYMLVVMVGLEDFEPELSPS